MINHSLKAFCKINLSLRVLKKISKNYHKIQSFVIFGNLYDTIHIKEIKEFKDKIIFFGKFKNKINNKSNTITKALKFIRKETKLSKKFFKIKIKKNIPHSSGLGGGSSDAASIIKFLNFKMKLNLDKNKIYQIANLVGSDVSLSLTKRNLFVTGKKITTFKLKNKFNVLIVFPKILCSTKKIYLKNRNFSSYHSIATSIFNKRETVINYLINQQNDLENTIIRIYPIIGKIIYQF